MQLFPVMKAETRAVEPPIASPAAIGPSKKHIVKKPVSEASFSRSVDCVDTAKGAMGKVPVMCGLVHGKILTCREVYLVL